jgi:hypothetical protein
VGLKQNKGDDIMRAALWISIITLLALLSLAACNSASDNSNPPGGAGSDPPELTAVNPAVNDNSVVMGSPVTATFDKEMNAASAGTFVVYGNQTGKLNGLYTGDGSVTLVFSRPGDAFKIGEEIEVILTGSLTATDGAPLNPPFVYRFRAEAIGGSGDFEIDDGIVGQLGARGMATGDWDDDGDIDLAVANSSATTVGVIKNDGFGDFVIFGTVGGQIGATALVTGDWDGDGDIDLAVANDTGGNNVGILRLGW